MHGIEFAVSPPDSTRTTYRVVLFSDFGLQIHQPTNGVHFRVTRITRPVTWINPIHSIVSHADYLAGRDRNATVTGPTHRQPRLAYGLFDIL